LPHWPSRQHAQRQPHDRYGAILSESETVTSSGRATAESPTCLAWFPNRTLNLGFGTTCSNRDPKTLRLLWITISSWKKKSGHEIGEFFAAYCSCHEAPCLLFYTWDHFRIRPTRNARFNHTSRANRPHRTPTTSAQTSHCTLTLSRDECSLLANADRPNH
jgi:hypothetical protein